MLWQVADEYEWRGGLVRPAENSATGVYSPLEYVEIATDLARVGNGSERIEEWVGAYGMLNWGSVSNISSRKSPTAESRMSLLAFADEVRNCVELIHRFQSSPNEDLARQIQQSFRQNLSQIHPMLVRKGSTTTGWSIAYAWRIPTLKDVVWLHLADFAADSDANVRACEECGSFFVATNAKQRFCPPFKGATWNERSKTRESRCALRSRQRRQRTGKATK